MNTHAGNQFTLNNVVYDGDQLPPDGQQLLALLAEAEKELVRLETRQTLLKLAQQQLIAQLKPLLPVSVDSESYAPVVILGQPSKEIPITLVNKPDVEPASFPENIPDEIRAKP